MDIKNSGWDDMNGCEDRGQPSSVVLLSEKELHEAPWRLQS